jgi:hypothetical protein
MLGALLPDTESPVDTASTSIDIPAASSTTTAAPATSTSTSTTAPEPDAEVLGLAVSDAALSAARSDLAGAIVLPSLDTPVDYDRDSYTGGGWPDSDGDCQSDRHEILIEESLIQPVLDAQGCKVVSGLWIDAYTAVEYTEASDVTIDHVIPLAAAHRSGAWQWDVESRQRFATDISFPAAHVAVGADVNQDKGDQAPDRWRPPEEGAWCTYAVDWISVKTRWSLAFSEAEVEALDEMLATCTTRDINTFATVTPPPANPTVTTTVAPTTTAAPSTTATTTTAAPVITTTAPPTTASNCHPNYEPCVPNVPYDLNCDDIKFAVRVIDSQDPYGFDGNDNDGLGCESYG